MNTQETTNSTKSRFVTGLFRNPSHAEEAYADLRNKGYSQEEINVIMTEDTRNKYFKGTGSELDNDDHAMEKGSVVGGVLGAVVGAATAIAVPGIGLIAAGPIAAGLAGAGIGGVAGGALGALAGAGVSDDFKDDYEKGIKEGGVFIGTNAKNDEDAEYVTQSWKNKGQYINFNH